MIVWLPNSQTINGETCCLFLIGSFKPIITPDVPHLVILKGGQLELRCEDNTRFDADRLRWHRDKGRRIEGEQAEDGATVIHLASVQPQHMGRYTCESTQTGERSSIYIYVKGARVPPLFLISKCNICSLPWSFSPGSGIKGWIKLVSRWLKGETTPYNWPGFLSQLCLI